MHEASLNCNHCGIPIPPRDLLTDAVGGQTRHFCCRGCQGAYRIITGAGLGSFYARRAVAEPGLPDGAFAAEWDDAYLGRFIINTPAGAEISFLLKGLRYASCVWLNEKILSGLDGVLQARVNYGTHRARVRFDPSCTSPAALFAAVGRLGYLPRPYTVDAAQK